MQHQTEYPPDYLNDLNAMHEAEEKLTDSQTQKYIDELVNVTNVGYRNYYAVYHATAAQRAEAFLRTLNLYAL